MVTWNIRFKNQLDQQYHVKLKKQSFDRSAVARRYRAMLQTLRDGGEIPEQSQSFIFPRETRAKMTRWSRPQSTILERRRTITKLPQKANEPLISNKAQGNLFATGLSQQFGSPINHSKTKSNRYAVNEPSRVARPSTSCSVARPVDMVERAKHRPRLSYSRLLSQGLMVRNRLLKEL